MALAFHARALWADDTGLGDRPNFGGITLAHNVESRDEVDQQLEQQAGLAAESWKPATEGEWGGFSGYFSDPAGHRWGGARTPLFRLSAVRHQGMRGRADARPIAWAGRAFPRFLWLDGRP